MQNLAIHTQNLSYKGILHDLNLTWRQGETIALMGPNGSGKSTLARLITGTILPTSGLVELTANDGPQVWRPNERWQTVALIGQHPRRQCIGASVAEELSFGLINLGLSNREINSRVREMLEAIGLEGKMNQSTATLSGGERQRLVTAAVLAMEPNFVIFDEALSMLDMRSQERILKLLEQTGKNAGKLWITHDPELARTAARLWLLEEGRLEDRGTPEDVLGNPLLCQKFHIRRHGEGLVVKPGAHKDKQDQKEETTSSPKTALQWQQAEIGNRLKLDKMVRWGEFVGIVGASGSGKSTLLESAVGLTVLSKGSLEFKGERLDKRSVTLLRRKIRILLQEAGEYLYDRKVRAAIFWGEKEIDAEVERHYLERFHLDPIFLARSPETLSGGEQQKVALAATLRTEPSVLLLDEPMLGLDAFGREAMTAVITDLISELRTDLTILYVTHDLCEVLPYADRIWLVENGTITLDCAAQVWSQYRQDFQNAGVRLPSGKQEVAKSGGRVRSYEDS